MLKLELASATSWSLKSLQVPEKIGHSLQLSNRCRATKYPIRALRYWYVAHTICAFTEPNKSIKVNEIGINVGEMRKFYRHHCEIEGRYELLDRWDGVDVDISHAPKELYTTLSQHDLVSDKALPHSGYDVVILLHVLEHLHDPEIAFSRICDTLAPGGIIIGGYPSTPQFLLNWREQVTQDSIALWSCELFFQKAH
jgi:SAM-dependent methyltransferase